MPADAPLIVHAVYLPPHSGLPYLAVRLEDGMAQTVPFGTAAEASDYNRQRPVHPPDLQQLPTLYRRLLREALRELLDARGDGALDDFRERAKLLLTIEVPNIPREQDEINQQAFDEVQQDLQRVRSNPVPQHIALKGETPSAPPPRSG